MKPPTKMLKRSIIITISIWYTLEIHWLTLFIIKELCGEADNRVPFIGIN